MGVPYFHPHIGERKRVWVISSLTPSNKSERPNSRAPLTTKLSSRGREGFGAHRNWLAHCMALQDSDMLKKRHRFKFTETKSQGSMAPRWSHCNAALEQEHAASSGTQLPLLKGLRGQREKHGRTKRINPTSCSFYFFIVLFKHEVSVLYFKVKICGH